MRFFFKTIHSQITIYEWPLKKKTSAETKTNIQCSHDFYWKYLDIIQQKTHESMVICKQFLELNVPNLQ